MVKTVKSIKKKKRFVFDTLLKINRFVKWLNSKIKIFNLNKTHLCNNINPSNLVFFFICHAIQFLK